MTTEAIFPETIPALLAWRARPRAAKPWLFFERDTWTLDDVLSEVDRLAVGLAERGVVHGDVVALLLGNTPETLFGWFAANRLGAIAMPLNPAYKAPELAGVFALTPPKVVIAASELRELVRAAGASAIRIEDLRSSGSQAPSVLVEPDDVAVLLATSGTTGAPKAVMQTHRTYTL